MTRYGIVAIGYNRPDSMERLLNALNRAFYDDEVDLIVSIDRSGTDSVEETAKKFCWEHGDKKICTYPERMGLRKHILHCGDFVNDYEAVAVFEDDVVPAPGFFYYMKKTVERYKDEPSVAGISLYNTLWNQTADKPFEPSNSEYDVYFVQYAQSWGQVWMRKQWQEFRNWYAENCDTDFSNERIPSNVRRWPVSSWLKYHIRYCIEKNLFFVYPYKSLTTCFSEAGEHTDESSSMYQVNCIEGNKMDYLLPAPENAIKYDAFRERMIDGVDVDIYRCKTKYNEKLVLSTRTLPYKIISSYGLVTRPHEANYLLNISGNEMFLYDTAVPAVNAENKNDNREMHYYFRLYNQSKKLMKYVKDRTLAKIRRKIGKKS